MKQIVQENWSKKRCLTFEVKPLKTKYYLAPKIIQPIKQKLELDKNFLDCIHNNHSFCADPKNSKK